MKIKVDRADRIFSMYIRKRDKKCRRCRKPVEFNEKGDPITHQASHFQGRRKEATRFDELNVDCLCFSCHRYFTENPGDHYRWQVEKKGQKVVDDIISRSNLHQKRDRKMAETYWKQRYAEMEKK